MTRSELLKKYREYLSNMTKKELIEFIMDGTKLWQNEMLEAIYFSITSKKKQEAK